MSELTVIFLCNIYYKNVLTYEKFKVYNLSFSDVNNLIGNKLNKTLNTVKLMCYATSNSLS